MTTTRRNSLETTLIFFCSLLVFTLGLHSQEIIGFDSRFYLFALEMWRHGASWFPMTYHQPYPDYPATSTFLIYLTAKIFGGMNKFVAVLPSAMAAAATVSFTYLIGALHSKRWGFCAVLFLLMTVTFLKGARSLSLDMYPTMITAWCFYLIYSADFYNRHARALWIYPLLLLSFAFRGPIGFVMPAAVVGMYYLCNRNFLRLTIFAILSLILLSISTAALLMLARHVGGDAFMQDVLRMEVMGRINDHFQPFYFYFSNGMKNYALSFPLAFLVLGGVFFYRYGAKKSPADTLFLLKLFGWMAIILLGMSIPGDKKIRYILPMIPAAALASAYIFIAPASEKFFVILRGFLGKIFLILPAIFALATEVFYYYTHDRTMIFGIHYWLVFTILIVLQAINFWIFYRYIDEKNRRETRTFFIAMLSFLATFIMVGEPIEVYFDTARDFVQAIERQRIEQHAQLVFYREQPDSLPIKYLINMPEETQPVFINSEQELLTFSAPAFFVTSDDYYAELPMNIAEKFEIVANDTLGHVRVVVFKRAGTSHE